MKMNETETCLQEAPSLAEETDTENDDRKAGGTISFKNYFLSPYWVLGCAGLSDYRDKKGLVSLASRKLQTGGGGRVAGGHRRRHKYTILLK